MQNATEFFKQTIAKIYIIDIGSYSECDDLQIIVQFTMYISVSMRNH